MPELPEVETIKCQLAGKLLGRTIEKVSMANQSLVFRDYPHKRKLPKEITGRKVLAVNRRGKYLQVELDDDLTLVLHLGMSGTLLVRDKAERRDRHCHLEIFFGDFKLTLRDPRMFGRVALFRNHDFSSMPGLANLGPEPLSREFNADWLAEKFRGRKASVKALLMDQAIGAGIGNIYADEACFVARVSPLRPAGKLNHEELIKLAVGVKKVLKRSLAAMGCTFSDYRTSEGETGDYRPYVYGREDRKCPKCGALIVKTIIANRSSWYCPKCQK
jgi:formamidopyrimidine-DNA glycosylase